MADKEKLIWLLCNAHSKSCEASAFDGISYAEQLVIEVDFLLENGVTFAKDTNVPRWIPVSERLPDENDVAEYIEKHSYAPEFLVMIKGATEPTVLQYDGELWSCDLGQTYTVTHWMPLPKPPKENRK